MSSQPNPVGRPRKKYKLGSVAAVIYELNTQSAILRVIANRFITGQTKTIGHLRTGLRNKAAELDQFASSLKEL